MVPNVAYYAQDLNSWSDCNRKCYTTNRPIVRRSGRSTQQTFPILRSKLSPKIFQTFLLRGFSQQIAFEFRPNVDWYETHDEEKVKIILKRDFRDVTANGIF
ncbi:hypothetical protein AVEN_123114-1 [Araneus ventricosus]|uniref:Uncharacterized protein n=1 Tax=Araneus ventricosus TaxID=182803 RepID=A0A4Y2M5Y1_ARAVE|nr:hypothetical protein AVEN_123114-1 [Araneus ventricosus]